MSSNFPFIMVQVISYTGLLNTWRNVNGAFKNYYIRIVQRRQYTSEAEFTPIALLALTLSNNGPMPRYCYKSNPKCRDSLNSMNPHHSHYHYYYYKHGIRDAHVVS